MLALGAQLRLQATLQTEVDQPIRADAADYFWYAYNLRESGVYAATPPGAAAPTPDAVRSPGYPLFLAALMDRPPTEGTIMRMIFAQALIGVLVIGLTFLLALPIVGRIGALGAALLVALSPHLVNAGVYLLTETLFSLALLAFLLVLARRDLETRLGWLALCGTLVGIAALVRPTVTYLPVVLAALFFVRWPARHAWRASAALMLGFGLIVTPWLARNAQLPDSASNDRLKINMLHHGMYPDLSYEGAPESYGFPYAADPRSAEIGASLSSVTAEIGRRFTEEPARHLKWYLLGKPLTLWSWNEPQGMGGAFVYPVLRSPYFESGWFRSTYNLMATLHWPVVILAGAFCLCMAVPAWHRSLPRRAVLPAQACALLLVYVTALHMVGFPLPRYVVPFRPELYLAACGALALFAEAVRRRSRAPAGLEPAAKT